jgi:hypothetical protein
VPAPSPSDFKMGLPDLTEMRVLGSDGSIRKFESCKKWDGF